MSNGDRFSRWCLAEFGSHITRASDGNMSAVAGRPRSIRSGLSYSEIMLKETHVKDMFKITQMYEDFEVKHVITVAYFFMCQNSQDFNLT